MLGVKFTMLEYMPNSTEFYHFGSTLVRETAWMSREDFKASSIARRASYSYLNALVEGSFKAVGRALKESGFPLKDSYRARFAQAAEVGVLPKMLSERLQHLAKLRNRTTHETSEVNETLEVYPALLEMIVISLAMSAIVGALHSSRPTRVSVTASRIRELSTPRNSDDPTSLEQQTLDAKLSQFERWIEIEYTPPPRVR